MVLFHGFPIGMKKLKNRLFFKKCQKDLSCEFQKTLIFQLKCGEWTDFFLLKNFKKLVFRNESKFWRVSKKRQKSSFFRIEFPIVHKKVVKKRLFPKSPISNRKVILVIFQKIPFFRLFFVQIYTFKKNFFLVISFGIFLFKKDVFRKESKF